MIILRQTDSPSGPGGSIVQSCRGFFLCRNLPFLTKIYCKTPFDVLY